MTGVAGSVKQPLYISSLGVYIQVDGEYAGRLPGKVEIVPDALTLLVPPDYRTELNFTRPG